jgi:hypothetical protein
MIPHSTVLAGARRRGALALLLAGSLLGCQDRRALPARVSPARREQQRPLDPASLGQDPRATLRALRMPAHRVVASLGAFRLTGSSRLITELPGSPKQEIDEEVTVRVDAKGQYAAQKTTHPQYGHEVIWTGGWLYPRLRWNRYVRRRPEGDEPPRLLDRLTGFLPAYVGLLRRFIRVELVGRETYAGREAVRIKLALAASPGAAPPEDRPARGWRRTLQVSLLEGEAHLDALSGAPLHAELAARWTFNAPAPGPLPPSGIPERIDASLVGKTELRFSLKLADLGHVAPIKPPPEAETVQSPRLTRTEIERQMITGELPIEDDWGPP